MALLKAGRVLESPFSGDRYEIIGPIGNPGGFGEAYRAEAVRPRGAPYPVVVKASLEQASWHREAYFGELLRGHKRVIQVYDTFPVTTTIKNAGQMYLLVSELAEHGTVSSHLEERGKGLPPGRAKREIIALLKVLVLLHGGSATHRDLTPTNVLVCRGGRLKLADFGIARHRLLNDKALPTATRNWWFAPTEFGGTPVDDAYMMGQLLAMLVVGHTDWRFDVKEVDDLPGDDDLHDVIRRAIGPAKERFDDAWEMLQVLEGRDEGHAGGVRALRNKKVMFTGPLAIRRADAETMVMQAGGRVVGAVSKSLDVIVIGGRSPHYKRAHKGTKLAEVDRLNRLGANIRKIGEAEFRRLAKSA